MEMRQDIHKLAVYLEKVCQEGIALERKVDEWKAIEVLIGHTSEYRQALEDVRRSGTA